MRLKAMGLFILLLVFVFLDIAMSLIALRYGAREVGVFFWLVGDFRTAIFIKGIFSFLLGMVLVAYNQVGLLKYANLFMFALTLYHGIMLAKTFG